MTSAAALQPLENLIQKRAISQGISRMRMPQVISLIVIGLQSIWWRARPIKSKLLALVGKAEHSKIPSFAFSTQQAIDNFTFRMDLTLAPANKLAKMSTQNIAPPKLAFTFLR